MASEPEQENSRGRILGIGGIFFKSADRDRLCAWYREHLGIQSGESGHMFAWRSREDPPREHFTIWSVFPDAAYFQPGNAPFMINYIVDDLDALLRKLETGGVRIDPKRENHDYGRFAWIYDPDGSKIELWEP